VCARRRRAALAAAVHGQAQCVHIQQTQQRRHELALEHARRVTSRAGGGRGRQGLGPERTARPRVSDGLVGVCLHAAGELCPVLVAVVLEILLPHAFDVGCGAAAASVRADAASGRGERLPVL
jgi:hypothetical protein